MFDNLKNIRDQYRKSTKLSRNLFQTEESRLSTFLYSTEENTTKYYKELCKRGISLPYSDILHGRALVLEI